MKHPQLAMLYLFLACVWVTLGVKNGSFIAHAAAFAFLGTALIHARPRG